MLKSVTGLLIIYCPVNDFSPLKTKPYCNRCLNFESFLYVDKLAIKPRRTKNFEHCFVVFDTWNPTDMIKNLLF